MAGYGYVQPKFGQGLAPRVKPLTPGRSIASAAAGTPTAVDPFGLGGGHETSPAPGVFTPHPTANIPPTQAPTATPPPAGGQAPQQQPVAPTTPVYDINTDPALQAVNAYTGLSDEQATAAANKQKWDELLAYGDANLARSVLGDESLAQAAANNPTSTLKNLSHQQDTNMHDLLTQLTGGGHNLGYGGYRIKQEGELGNQYQNALAQAASGINSGLGSVDASLAAALGANQQTRIGAQGEAYARALAYALANPPVAGASGAPAGISDLYGTPTANRKAYGTVHSRVA